MKEYTQDFKGTIKITSKEDVPIEILKFTALEALKAFSSHEEVESLSLDVKLDKN